MRETVVTLAGCALAGFGAAVGSGIGWSSAIGMWWDSGTPRIRHYGAPQAVTFERLARVQGAAKLGLKARCARPFVVLSKPLKAAALSSATRASENP
jgi:hypothetical protein